jgi:hypothetical protein
VVWVSFYIFQKLIIFRGKQKLGPKSNLFALLRLVVRKDVTTIQVYGDLKLVIDWMIDNVHLSHLDLL